MNVKTRRFWYHEASIIPATWKPWRALEDQAMVDAPRTRPRILAGSSPRSASRSSPWASWPRRVDWSGAEGLIISSLHLPRWLRNCAMQVRLYTRIWANWGRTGNVGSELKWAIRAAHICLARRRIQAANSSSKIWTANSDGKFGIMKCKP